MGNLGHLWSLAVEEQFYLVWPLILVVAAPLGRARGVLAAAVALCLTAPVIRALAGEDYPRVSNGLDTRMDALMAGAVLALAHRLWPRWTSAASRVVALPAAAVLLWLGMVEHAVPLNVYYTAMTWASVAVIALLACGGVRWVDRGFAWRPFVWLGRISYGVYLWHYPVLGFLVDEVGIGYALRLPVTAVVSVIAAYLSFTLVERPLSRRLRPLLTPRSS